MRWGCRASGVSALAERAHEEAVRRGENTYVDPVSRRSVFTAAHHLKRGHCCGCGCRHCPYPSEDPRKPPQMREPALAETSAAG